MHAVFLYAVSGGSEEEEAQLQQCGSLGGGMGRQRWHSMCQNSYRFKPLCLVEYEPLIVFGSAILSKSVTSLHTVITHLLLCSVMAKASIRSN